MSTLTPRAKEAIKTALAMTMRQYAVPELIAAIELTELRVAKDPHFGPDRVFDGFVGDRAVQRKKTEFPFRH